MITPCVCVCMYSTTAVRTFVHSLHPCRKQQKQESSLNTLSTTIRALDSLLSLATVISEALRATTPTAKSTQRHSRRESHMDINQCIDSKSASNLCTTAIHLVKHSLFRKEDETDVPILKGCDRFDTQRACSHQLCMCVLCSVCM